MKHRERRHQLTKEDPSSHSWVAMTRGHGDSPGPDKPWRRRLVIGLMILAGVLLVIEFIGVLRARR